MKTIYKYKLDLNWMAIEGSDRQTIDMPTTALLNYIGIQNDEICLWAEVDTNYLSGQRTFCIIGTGQPFPKDVKSYDYKATLQMGKFVWHIYEIKKES